LSIVQLSRFFSAVPFKRQLLYFIKSFSLCQELFYFSVSFDLAFSCPSQTTAFIGYHIQISLSTTFLIDFQSFQSLPIRNVPPPRLLCSSVLLLSSVLFLSDERYLTMPVPNCQYFLYFSCNSEYSDNSIYFLQDYFFHIITDTSLYSRKFFRSQKNPHAFGRMHTDSFTDLYCKLAVLTRHFIRVLIKKQFY